jgi:hypothetical protein
MRIALMLCTALAAAPAPSFADEFTETVEGALEAYRAGDVDAAREDLDYAVKILAGAKAGALAALLPEPAAGWRREQGEDATAAMAMFGGGVSASAVYRRGEEDFTLTLLADSPMVSSIGAMMGGLAAVPDVTTRRIERETFAVTDGQIQGVIDDRVLVTAEGSAPVEAMFEAIERLDFKGLKDF